MIEESGRYQISSQHTGVVVLVVLEMSCRFMLTRNHERIVQAIYNQLDRFLGSPNLVPFVGPLGAFIAII